MVDRAHWDPEMAAFTAAAEAEAAKYPPVRVALPLEPHRRINDLLGMRTAVGGPVMAETTDRWVAARGRRIFCRVFRPVTGRVLPTLVYFHGGGWVWANVDTHDRMTREYAAAGQVNVVSVDYALSPEAKFPAALEEYRASLAIAERLVKAELENAGWQRDLALSHNRIGEVLRAQGNLPEALESFRASQAIAERLVTVNAGNTGWQRDLAGTHNQIGDVLVEQGDLPGALESFQALNAIYERMATADAGNTSWQRDLGVTLNKIGKVLDKQGNLPAALERFSASLTIAERLVRMDAGNSVWQRDLAISNELVGDICSRQGNRREARKAFERALGAYDVLVTLHPGDVQSRVFSVWPRRQLAGLDPDRARDHLRAALAILKPLAQANRLDANRLTWIPQMEAQLAALEK